jgi:hypothetical protein
VSAHGTTFTAVSLAALETVAGGRGRGRRVHPDDQACASAIQDTLALTERTPQGLVLRFPEGYAQGLVAAEACDRSPSVRAIREADRLARQPRPGGPR